jgi:phosphoribosylformimino-5-aminoimidazole carboxamide ribotide isomerase
MPLSATPRRFEVIPAIDLAAGRVVRLVQGRFEAVTTFDADPISAARGFWRDGARSLHVIDLDAARTGTRTPPHQELITRLAAERPAGGTLQVGGGFRSADQVDAAISLGVDRVLVGTLAFREPAILDQLVTRHGDRICVTADTLAGTVRVAGWAQDAGLAVTDAVRELTARGVRRFLVTAIERDGTLAGPDLRLMHGLRDVTDAYLLASGGVGSLSDITAIRGCGVDGVVVGRALLAGAFTLPDALAIEQQA